MIAPSIDYYDRAWDEARHGVPSSRPFSQMVIQSATDPTVAPEGQHTLSLWCHHFPYALATMNGRNWTSTSPACRTMK